VRGRSLHARAAARDDAPPLLLTGAWPQSIRCWDGHWHLLAERFSLLALDLPGFGRSPGERALMRPSAQAAVLADAIEQLGRGPVTLVAPDVGVPVALALAQDYPDTVAGLVLFNGPAHYPPDMSLELALLSRSRAYRASMRLGGVPFTLIALRRGYRVARPSRDAVREYVRIAADPRRFGLTLDYQASYPEGLPRIAARLDEVTVPVLLPWGVEDPFVRMEEGERLAAALPNATWAPLDRCGHFAHEDAGGRFVELLAQWHATAVAAPAAR
jgi:pimeloyl-ACP methyl ester carboxylesterase